MPGEEQSRLKGRPPVLRASRPLPFADETRSESTPTSHTRRASKAAAISAPGSLLASS